MTSTNKPGEKLTVTSRGFNASGLYHTTKGNVYGQVVPLGDHNAPGKTVFAQAKAFERPTTAVPELHRTTGNMTTHMQRHGLKNRWPAWYPRSGSGCVCRLPSRFALPSRFLAHAAGCPCPVRAGHAVAPL